MSMLDITKLYEIFITLSQQILNAVTVPTNWIQVAMIVFSLFIGWLVRRRLTPIFTDRIGRSGLNFRIRQTLTNFTKLILQTVAVIILGLLIQIQGTDGGFTWDTSIAVASIKLLMAWVAIRFASQVIENTFARQSVALTAWIIAALSIMGFLDDTVGLLEGIGFSIGESKITALAVIKAILMIWALLYAAIFISKLTERKLENVSSLTPSSRVLISKIMRVFLVTVGLLVGITSAGVDLSLLAVFG